MNTFFITHFFVRFMVSEIPRVSVFGHCPYLGYFTLYINCLCGSVAKASDIQAVGHGFDPRPDH